MFESTGSDEVDFLFSDAEEETSQFGNRRRTLFLETDRYRFDFELDLSEWRQFDTESDAWYFGIWINKERRMILCYAEGDASLTVCNDDAAYDAEVGALCAFHGPQPSFVAIDVEARTRTEIYQDRSELFIDPSRSGLPVADQVEGVGPETS